MSQVGRLSRQAGEEGAERRSAEAKVAELEAKLEEEVKERERLNGRVLKLTEECVSLSNDLKAANAQVVSNFIHIILEQLPTKVFNGVICIE